MLLSPLLYVIALQVTLLALPTGVMELVGVLTSCGHLWFSHGVIAGVTHVFGYLFAFWMRTFELWSACLLVDWLGGLVGFVGVLSGLNNLVSIGLGHWYVDIGAKGLRVLMLLNYCLMAMLILQKNIILRNKVLHRLLLKRSPSLFGFQNVLSFMVWHDLNLNELRLPLKLCFGWIFLFFDVFLWISFLFFYIIKFFSIIHLIKVYIYDAATAFGSNIDSFSFI